MILRKAIPSNHTFQRASCSRQKRCGAPPSSHIFRTASTVRISLDHLLPIPIKSLSADTAGHIRFNSSEAKRTPIYPAMCSARIVSDNFYLWYFLPNNKPSEPECPNRFNGKAVNLKSDLCEKRSCQPSDFIHIFLTYSLSCLYRPSDGQMDVLLTVSRMSV